MKHERELFAKLVGSEVEILLPDQSCLGPVTLEEVSEEGIRFTEDGKSVAIPWEEIVQISPLGTKVEALDDDTEAELAEGVVEMDSEP